MNQCFSVVSDLICHVFTAREDNLQCPLLQELQCLWLCHSQPGMSDWDWAGILEVWTRCITVLKQTLRWAREWTKIHISRPQNEKKSGEGCPLSRPFPIYSCCTALDSPAFDLAHHLETVSTVSDNKRHCSCCIFNSIPKLITCSVDWLHKLLTMLQSDLIFSFFLLLISVLPKCDTRSWLHE